jgi:hypothetical protein
VSLTNFLSAAPIAELRADLHNSRPFQIDDSSIPTEDVAFPGVAHRAIHADERGLAHASDPVGDRIFADGEEGLFALKQIENKRALYTYNNRASAFDKRDTQEVVGYVIRISRRVRMASAMVEEKAID